MTCVVNAAKDYRKRPKIPYMGITASPNTAKLAAELTLPCTFVGYVSSMILS
jgi:hypothetical protein